MNTYGELKTEVADWLNREDLTAKIPLFVRLAETEIYRGLRCQDNEFRAIYNNAGWRIEGHPSQVLSDGIARNLPSNYMELKLVTWNGRPLQMVSDATIALSTLRQSDATPLYYCMNGRFVQFSQDIPTDPATWEDGAELVYTYYGTESLDSMPPWQVPTNPVETPVVEDTAPNANTQTDANTTRMLQTNPDLYLHGSLYFAGLYLKDAATAQQYKALFSAALEEKRVEATFNMVSGSTSEVTQVYN
tara:strand:- start:9587 stop:10327 length:741 start_codon:yes stop_codon:yes gene_type:complete